MTIPLFIFFFVSFLFIACAILFMIKMISQMSKENLKRAIVGVVTTVFACGVLATVCASVTAGWLTNDAKNFVTQEVVAPIVVAGRDTLNQVGSQVGESIEGAADSAGALMETGRERVGLGIERVANEMIGDDESETGAVGAARSALERLRSGSGDE